MKTQLNQTRKGERGPCQTGDAGPKGKAFQIPAPSVAKKQKGTINRSAPKKNKSKDWDSHKERSRRGNLRLRDTDVQKDLFLRHIVEIGRTNGPFFTRSIAAKMVKHRDTMMIPEAKDGVDGESMSLYEYIEASGVLENKEGLTKPAIASLRSIQFKHLLSALR